MSGGSGGRRLLLAGGSGGLLGRALLEALPPNWTVRSVHRHPSRRESERGVEWVGSDLAAVTDWDSWLRDCDAVANLAWYRWGSEARFRSLYEGLSRLLTATRRRGIPFLQVSVPEAPAHLETGIPYLVYKRRFDAAVRESQGPYSIVRPTLMFGPGDVLLGVMLRSIRRYPVFPMFGDGSFRISPVAAADVARLLVRLLGAPANATVDVGGPASYRYRDVTDRMYALLGKRPRYWRMTPRGGRRLATLLQALGSTKLYAYEVEWLVSDTLSLRPSGQTDWSLTRVEPYLRSQTEELTGRPAPDLGPMKGQA